MAIPLIDKDDVISHRGKKEKDDINNKVDRVGRVIVKKEKKEKPIRVLRIKFYEKMSLPFMKDGKIRNKEIFAVNRGLEDLLKDLCCNTDVQGNITPSDCIWVEKDDKVYVGNKFIFIDINKDKLALLKRQLENQATIYAFNMGEFSILEGGRSYLEDTWSMPKVWKPANVSGDNRISGPNKIVEMERLREELKDKLRPYHSKSDEDIDNMTDRELIAIKKLANEKMKIENRKRKAYKTLLR